MLTPERKAKLQLEARILEIKELTEVLDALDNAERWVADLQSGMFINCVYCGHRYGPKGTTAATLKESGCKTMAEALTQHIENCPSHPLSAMKARVAALETELKEVKHLAYLEDFRSKSGGGVGRTIIRDKKNHAIKLFAVVAGEDAEVVAKFLKELDS